MSADIHLADVALRRLSMLRAAMTDDVFYRQCDRLLDMRNRAALVARLEAEHASELAGVL